MEGPLVDMSKLMPSTMVDVYSSADELSADEDVTALRGERREERHTPFRTASRTDRHVHVWLGPEEEEEFTEASSTSSDEMEEEYGRSSGVDRSGSDGASSTGTDGRRRVRRHTRGKGRRRLDEGAQAPRTRAFGGPKAQLMLGAQGYIRSLKVEKDDLADKVDTLFQEMKVIVFDRLKSQGQVTDGDKAQFRMRFDHRRSIVQWWVNGADAAAVKKGTYDYKNDYGQNEATPDQARIKTQRERLDELSKEIVTATAEISGMGVNQIQDIPHSCLGPVGRVNLSHHFNHFDIKHEKFAGNLATKEGTAIEVRRSVFNEFMKEDFVHAKKKGHARDTKEVAKDIASSLVYQKALEDRLKVLEARYRAAYQAALHANDGEEDDTTKAIAKKYNEVAVLLRRVEGMHMNPLFVSQTYAPETDRNIFKRADKLRVKFYEHYAELGKAKRHGWTKTMNGLRLKKYTESKGYDKLAIRLAGMSAFTTRKDYQQYCELNHAYAAQSLGLEEVFFKRMLEVGPTGQYQIGLFNGMHDETQREIYEALDAARAKVHTMRGNIDAGTPAGATDEAITALTTDQLQIALG